MRGASPPANAALKALPWAGGARQARGVPQGLGCLTGRAAVL